MNTKNLTLFDELRGSMVRLVKFHLGWNLAGLIFSLALGALFRPGGVASADISNMSATEALFTRLPGNALLWSMMIVVTGIGLRYAAFLAATAMGKTTAEMPAQARAVDGNGSPAILRKAYMKGLAIMLVKVVLLNFSTTIWMLAIRFFLYNLALVLFSVWFVRKNSGVRSWEQWKDLYKNPGTDDPTRDVDTAAFFAGALGLVLP